MKGSSLLGVVVATFIIVSAYSSGLCAEMHNNATTTTGKATLDRVVATGVSRLTEGAVTQETVDKLHTEHKSLQAEYHHLLKLTDGVKVYNKVLAAQVSQQEQEIDELEVAIQDAAKMERRIIPLLTDMVTTLDKFVASDVPFLLTERRFRVAELKKLISRSDVSTAEKMRRVLQAYQIEGDYGRTIEAYRDQIEFDSEMIAVEFLRVGRIGLMYQTLDGSASGAWNREIAEWVSISDFSFKQNLKQGLKMAKKQMAPSMLLTPVFSVGNAE
ncbi:MAG: DUF3450 domain-containing protein [Pseudomonadales bacterium]|nr:DUF3450 domain-containing protein [Pseudomonadales bacterium]